MIVLFIIVIGIILFCAIRGLKKGLFGIIFGIFAWIFTIALLFFMAPRLDTYLTDHTTLDESIQTRVSAFVLDKLDAVSAEDLANLAKQTVSSGSLDSLNFKGVSLPEGLSETVGGILGKYFGSENAPISSSGEALGSAVEQSVADAKQAVAQAAAEKITAYAMTGISVLLTFLIARIITLLIGLLLRGIERHTPIGGISRGLGLIFGTFEGFVYDWFLFYLIGCAGATSAGQSLLAMIEGNVFMNWMYTHNLVEMLIVRFF